MKLGLVPPFSCCVGKCQCFCEYRQSSLWLSQGSMCFCEERQIRRSCDLCSCGTIRRQALSDLLDAFLRLSLVCQRPGTHERTDRHPVGKSLFRDRKSVV